MPLATIAMITFVMLNEKHEFRILIFHTFFCSLFSDVISHWFESSASLLKVNCRQHRNTCSGGGGAFPRRPDQPARLLIELPIVSFCVVFSVAHTLAG